LFEPLLQNYFVQNKAFPFSHEGFLGHETAILNVFTFWNHYRNKYATQMQNVKVPLDSFNQYNKEMGIQIDTESEEEDIHN